MKSQPAKGFTLIELMVALAIISVLAAIALPEFRSYLVKSRRSEAYLGLGGIYSAQISFKADSDTFSASFLQVGFDMDAGSTPNNMYCLSGSYIACGQNYTFKMELASKNMFQASSVGYPLAGGGSDTLHVFYPPF